MSVVVFPVMTMMPVMPPVVGRFMMVAVVSLGRDRRGGAKGERSSKNKCEISFHEDET
jgi:hypothetical protein